MSAVSNPVYQSRLERRNWSILKTDKKFFKKIAMRLLLTNGNVRIFIYSLDLALRIYSDPNEKISEIIEWGPGDKLIDIPIPMVSTYIKGEKRPDNPILGVCVDLVLQTTRGDQFFRNKSQTAVRMEKQILKDYTIILPGLEPLIQKTIAQYGNRMKTNQAVVWINKIFDSGKFQGYEILAGKDDEFKDIDDEFTVDDQVEREIYQRTHDDDE
jgi:hypothetical protein